MKLRETIEKYWKSFLSEKEGADYDYGCVMLEVNISSDKWDEIQSHIADEDIHEGDQFGREDNPHLTLLYGIHGNVSDEQVREVCESFDPITIKLKETSIFENGEYDVIKFGVTDKNLTKYNGELRDKLRYTNNYPDYKAHVTICYVKAGKGKEIIKKLNDVMEEMEFSCSEVRYSKANKEKLYFKLTSDE
jgi:2'-5' RNA ligase